MRMIKQSQNAGRDILIYNLAWNLGLVDGSPAERDDKPESWHIDRIAARFRLGPARIKQIIREQHYGKLLDALDKAILMIDPSSEEDYADLKEISELIK